MPVKEKILKELESSAKKFKALKLKFKGSKKFFIAMEELLAQGVIEEVNGFIRLVKKSAPVGEAPVAHVKVGDKIAPVQEVKPVVSPENGNLQGTVVKLTENFGFVRVADMAKDVFVAGKFMLGAIVGDEVEMKKIPSPRHDFEGQIVAITKEKTNVVASIDKHMGRTFAALRDCPTLSLPVENKTEAAQGDVVLVDVTGRGKGHHSLKAKVTMIIGQISSSEKAVELLLAEKGVGHPFDAALLEEAEGVISRIDMVSEKAHRIDLTALPIFTIDSASTKDIDDAICVQKTNDGYNLGVHIADVSHYVRPTSLCNNEAFERGNSIYYGDSVIPMLPTEYSNDVCSLNENTEKLAFTCDMQLNKQGDVTGYKFYKSVISSRVKGVYSEINKILSGDTDPELKAKYAQVETEIFAAKDLYDTLKKKREARGSMDIESDEAYIIFDKTGHAVDIKKRERGLSEMIIEECMLLANSCSANLAKKANLPFVYRVHESPDPEKLNVLKNNLRRFGLTLEPKEGQSLQQAMSELLDKTRDTNLQQVIHKGVLRCQAKAKYSENPIGHFGLALEDYAHFTSPIRRYSDLAIHRILTDYVNGAASDKITVKFSKFAKAASQQTSRTELVAMQIERGSADIYKAEIMEKHIGEVFEGTVTSLTSFGIYVTLENTVEGLAHISTLNMVSPILTEGYSLECPISGIGYKMGDSIKVQVMATDILKGNIDFSPVGKDGKAQKAVRTNEKPNTVRGSARPAQNNGPRTGGYKKPAQAEEKKIYAKSDKKPHSYGDKKPYAQGDKKPYAQGDKKPYAQGDKKPYAQDDKKPHSYGDKKPYAQGDKKPYATGDRKPVEGKKPLYSKDKKSSYSKKKI